jgi:hypothetical protein
MWKLGEIAAWALAPVMLVVMIAVTGSTNLMGDFRAFSCGGSAIAAGASPYLEEPLHSCEQRAKPPAPPSFLPYVTLPAPLPPGTLAAFVPLSWLPFPWAAAVFALLSFVAMSGAVVLFARLIGTSTMVLNVAFAAITATQTYFLGQPVTFVYLAVAATAFFVRRGRWVAASGCAVAATAEPHIALPVIVAMVLALPRTRLPIVGFIVVLGCIGVAAVGITTSISYVRDVLPAHALANAYEWQFSLTSILTSVGVDGPAAVRWGEAMYGGMVIAGLVVARRMWRSTGDRVALVLVPPAFAMFGGVHVHYQQLAIAFPALLWVYAHDPRRRTLAATAVTLAMIPWNIFGGSLMIGFTPLLVGWFARVTMGARRGLALVALATVIAMSVLALALTGLGPRATHFVAHHDAPTALAEANWARFSRSELSRPSVLLQWLRVPVMLGLGMGLIAIARAAYARPALRTPAS